jgi:hypothetical protein
MEPHFTSTPPATTRPTSTQDCVGGMAGGTLCGPSQTWRCTGTGPPPTPASSHRARAGPAQGVLRARRTRSWGHRGRSSIPSWRAMTRRIRRRHQPEGRDHAEIHHAVGTG